MIDNMDIDINNVQFVGSGDDEKAHIHFRGKDPNNELNLSGYVPITMSEYETDSSIEGLKSKVKSKVSERLT